MIPYSHHVVFWSIVTIVVFCVCMSAVAKYQRDYAKKYLEDVKAQRPDRKRGYRILWNCDWHLQRLGYVTWCVLMCWVFSISRGGGEGWWFLSSLAGVVVCVSLQILVRRDHLACKYIADELTRMDRAACYRDEQDRKAAEKKAAEDAAERAILEKREALERSLGYGRLQL